MTYQMLMRLLATVVDSPFTFGSEGTTGYSFTFIDAETRDQVVAFLEGMEGISFVATGDRSLVVRF
jgi:hypothetical protein